MSRSEALYLMAVLALGGIFAAASLREAALVISPGSDRAPTGAAGEPRDVDMRKLLRLIRRGDLSTREALFYKRLRPEPARDAPAAQRGGAGDVLVTHHRVRVMGTEGTLTAVMAERRRSPVKDALAAAEGVLHRIDGLMSTYKESSEISRFNAAERGTVPLSEETLRVLRAARWLHSRTRGAFDVTCRPLIDLWRGSAKEDRVPGAREIEEVRSLSRWDRIELLGEAATKDGPGVRLDLGGIAKGYAVDRAIERLRIAGCDGGAVELGGDLRCFGRSPEPGGWRIAVRHPFEKGRSCAEIAMPSGAVCTSGGYERFWEIGGKRYSHIMDPRTGLPAEAASSATVAASTAMMADAWATALSVLGPSGLDLLPRDHSVEAMVVTGPKKAPRVRMTPGFRALLIRGPEF